MENGGPITMVAPHVGGFIFTDRGLADLAGKQDIGGNKLLESIRFRSLGRRLFA